MAESISEGTLKTWLKQPGETVAADEEVATIETDKVRVPSFSLHSVPLCLVCVGVNGSMVARSYVHM